MFFSSQKWTGGFLSMLATFSGLFFIIMDHEHAFSFSISCLSFSSLRSCLAFARFLGWSFDVVFLSFLLSFMEQQTFDPCSYRKLPSHIFTNNILYMCHRRSYLWPLQPHRLPFPLIDHCLPRDGFDFPTVIGGLLECVCVWRFV